MAEAALNRIARSLDRKMDSNFDKDLKGSRVRLMSASAIVYITTENHAFIETLNIVLWAPVLSLICANLGNLLLTRGSRRRREVAVCPSVGASRPRLIRQLLTESVLLSFAGGLAGIVLAYGITHAMSSLPVPFPTPQEFNFQADFRALAVTLAISLASGVGFGLAPALSAARIEKGGTLKEGAQAPPRGHRRFGSRNLFVVCQMAAP